MLHNILEPRKEKTDSSNSNNGALSPQELQQQQQQQQANMHGGHHNMMMAPNDGRGGDGTPIMKPERPNSLGPNKLSKRINFYHSDNCKNVSVISVLSYLILFST